MILEMVNLIYALKFLQIDYIYNKKERKWFSTFQVFLFLLSHFKLQIWLRNFAAENVTQRLGRVKSIVCVF